MSHHYVTLHIITGLSTGGAERALYNLLQGGLNTQFNSQVISLIDKGTMGEKIEKLGVPVITLDMPAGRPTLASIFKLRRIIKDLQPDLIQGWMYHGNLVATLARFFCSKKVPVIWNVRQSLYQIEKEKRLTRWVIKANRLLSKSVDKLLYNSQLSREQHEAFGFASEKGQVIPNGINCQQFSYSAKAREQVRAELDMPSESLVVGHVARFHPMKGHASFLQAAVSLAEKYPDVHFMLSGREVTLTNPALKQHVPPELENRFYLLGERRDISDLMSAMDILCSSSGWGEAFPNVLGEAIAVGVPCVATDVGDSALIVGECGCVVKPGDSAVLEAGIESLLIMPESERKHLGEQGRQRIEDNFTLSVIVERYAERYKSIISDKRYN